MKPYVWMIGVILAAAFAGCDSANSGTSQGGSKVTLLNASYDPTRELWKDLNGAFAQAYENEQGGKVEIKQSHGGSGSQARNVIDGLEADVVTLAMWSDTDAISKRGLLAKDWEKKFPNRSLPYTSTIVFVVREGNPKGIKDWADLVKPGIEVITPNPKTSGNGKLAFLAAWGSVSLKGANEDAAREFVTKLYSAVPVLDTAARGATTTFAQRGIGDVHLTWENEAHLEVAESGNKLEIVFPTQSILAEPHIALVDSVVDKKGTRAAAEAYLNFLYTPEGQAIIAKHFYRPIDEKVLSANRDKFPNLKLFPITDLVANWDESQKKFFADGGVFDTIYNDKK